MVPCRFFVTILRRSYSPTRAAVVSRTSTLPCASARKVPALALQPPSLAQHLVDAACDPGWQAARPQVHAGAAADAVERDRGRLRVGDAARRAALQRRGRRRAAALRIVVERRRDVVPNVSAAASSALATATRGRVHAMPRPPAAAPAPPGARVAVSDSRREAVEQRLLEGGRAAARRACATGAARSSSVRQPGQRGVLGGAGRAARQVRAHRLGLVGLERVEHVAAEQRAQLVAGQPAFIGSPSPRAPAAARAARTRCGS